MKALLFSGGMDSLIAAKYLQPDILYYSKLGHKYEKCEIEAVQRLANVILAPIFIMNNINLSYYEEADANIPLRNLYLCMQVVNNVLRNYKDEKKLIINLIVQKDETSIPDRTQEFFQRGSELLSILSGISVSLQTPFWNMDKTDMVKWWIDSGYKKDALVEKSYSCYKGEIVECGDCPACFRKWVALINNGIKGKFLVDPARSNTAKNYARKIEGYSKNRARRIKDAFALADVFIDELVKE